jgi:hypothetical protein
MVRVSTDPQPSTMSDEVAAVCESLAALEPIFHHPELGASRSDFEESTIADYWEVGASGRVYGREDIWPVLEERYSDPDVTDEWETTEFFCRPLGSETYLLTYVLRQAARLTRRATVWRRTGATWQVVYHQGTIIDPG